MASSKKNSDHQEPERILVYDDEQVILDLLALVLSREGYEVAATPSDEEAHGLVSTQAFDLAITDLGLRRSNGCKLVKTIRDLSPDTTVVAISAYPAREVVRFARENAQAFLQKPFALSDLLSVVREALGDESLAEAPGETTSASQEGLQVTRGNA
ncbi:MAG: response regulator [Anaerolineae bacterium]|nr:response regulator [Anaerolineae bacterium]NIN97555.1 response regulator [Anaerolineae bacterium]NIQ80483.1 response regulator [Anaerolineae bacterium]